MSPGWRKALADDLNAKIAGTGWAVVGVGASADGAPPFAYTVGMTARDVPELLIVGLGIDTMHKVLNDLAARVHGGEVFTHGQRLEDLLADYPAVLVDGDPPRTLSLGVARARYGLVVQARQIVWPDAEGRFPWDPGCVVTGYQTVIGRP